DPPGRHRRHAPAGPAPAACGRHIASARLAAGDCRQLRDGAEAPLDSGIPGVRRAPDSVEHLAANELLDSTETLVSRSGRLWLTRPAARQAFEKAIGLLLDGEGAGTQGYDVPVHMEDGRLLTLYLLPLESALSGARSQAVAIMAGPRGEQRDACDIVASLFGLTPSERRVLSRIAKGEAVKEAAESLAVGEATVRTHL